MASEHGVGLGAVRTSAGREPDIPDPYPPNEPWARPVAAE